MYTYVCICVCVYIYIYIFVHVYPYLSLSIYIYRRAEDRAPATRRQQEAPPDPMFDSILSYHIILYGIRFYYIMI